MAQILLLEPVEPVREFLRLHLETAGYRVTAAADVATAAQLIRDLRPELIVCADAQTRPLAEIHAHAGFAQLPPVIGVTSGEPQGAPRPAGLEVHGVLALPVTRDELLCIVRSALGDEPSPALIRVQAPSTPAPTETWVQARAAWLHAPEMSRTPAREPDVLPAGGDLESVDASGVTDPGRGESPTTLASQEARSGTVLFADIRNFSTLAETLSTQEVAEMLNAYFVRACEPVLQQRGWIVKLLGDGMLAMFEGVERQTAHAERALKAALFLCVVSDRFNRWLAQRFPDRQLPGFAVGIGVHTGDVMVCRINTGAGVDTTIIGDTVNVASRLEEQTKAIGASVVTSMETLAGAGARFVPGKRGALLVRGRSSPVEMTEILGLRARPEADARTLQTYELIREAVARNARVVARGRERLLGEPHRIRDTGQFDPLRPADAPIKIPGFKLLRKLGEGGMSRAFLAEYEQTGALRVVKALNVSRGGFDLLRRFVQEHELISQIHHPNVANIYDFGQTDTHAYIVIEYFPAGDLRQRMGTPLPAGQALDYLAQVAEALVAIHARGIVHRDLKPDNLMLREDGTLVLADFGIAKDLSATLTHTRRGEGLGTPYYLSPEQALGKEVDPRSDLYSLGVMLHEMLTGAKPYHAQDAMALLHQHITAPLPILPAECSSLQPVLERLMAKSPAERFASAQLLLTAIEPHRCPAPAKKTRGNTRYAT
jgi:class 3 adenylate cyclase